MVKIAVASGKGGTGKTFIATNLAFSLLRNNSGTILVDCDAETPDAVAFFDTKESGRFEVMQEIPVIDTDACTFCGKCSEYCNYNAIFILHPVKIIQVIRDLCHGCGACTIACKFGAITEQAESLGHVTTYSVNGPDLIVEARANIGVMSPVPVIKAALKRINGLPEYIILDAPPGTSCPFVQTVAASDYVILVTEPTPFGLSDLKLSVETLRNIDKPFGVIINRAGLGYDKVKEYLNQENIPELLEVPFSKEIARMYSNGELYSEKDTLFAGQLLSIGQNIVAKYGNSGYQR